MPGDLGLTLIALLATNIPPIVSMVIAIAQFFDQRGNVKTIAAATARELQELNLLELQQQTINEELAPNVEIDGAYAGADQSTTAPTGPYASGPISAANPALPPAIPQSTLWEERWGSADPANSDIVRKTEERHAKEQSIADQALDSMVSAVQRQYPVFNEIFPNASALELRLRQAILNDQMLLLPCITGLDRAQTMSYFATLSQGVKLYNTTALQRKQMMTQQAASARARQAQEALMAYDILAPDLIWNQQRATVAQMATCEHTTICIQTTVSDDGVRFQIWYWVFDDPRLRVAERHAARLSPIQYFDWTLAHADLQPIGGMSDQLVLALLQLITYLIVDGVSVSAYEGVSILTDTFDQLTQRPSGETTDLEQAYHTAIRRSVSGVFGPMGPIGIPAPPPPPPTGWREVPADSADAVILTDVRGGLCIDIFAPAFTGYMSWDNSGARTLHLASAVSGMDEVALLAIEGHDPNMITIRYLILTTTAQPLQAQEMETPAEWLMRLTREAAATYHRLQATYRALPGKGSSNLGERLRQHAFPERSGDDSDDV